MFLNSVGGAEAWPSHGSDRAASCSRRCRHRLVWALSPVQSIALAALSVSVTKMSARGDLDNAEIDRPHPAVTMTSPW